MLQGTWGMLVSGKRTKTKTTKKQPARLKSEEAFSARGTPQKVVRRVRGETRRRALFFALPPFFEGSPLRRATF
jgi:hypothetical protein